MPPIDNNATQVPRGQLGYIPLLDSLTSKYQYMSLSRKYPTLFFPGKTSDGRLANLITVVGGPFMRMRDLLWLRPVRLSLLDS
jgi:hypothetical protein